MLNKIKYSIKEGKKEYIEKQTKYKIRTILSRITNINSNIQDDDRSRYISK
jgi:hypothetical protein